MRDGRDTSESAHSRPRARSGTRTGSKFSPLVAADSRDASSAVSENTPGAQRPQTRSKDAATPRGHQTDDACIREGASALAAQWRVLALDDAQSSAPTPNPRLLFEGAT